MNSHASALARRRRELELLLAAVRTRVAHFDGLAALLAQKAEELWQADRVADAFAASDAATEARAERAQAERELADVQEKAAGGWLPPDPHGPETTKLAAGLAAHNLRTARERGYDPTYWRHRARTPAVTRRPRTRGAGRPAARRTRTATRDGPSADDGGEPPGLAGGELDRVRQLARLRRRYPNLSDLAAALRDFWGAGDAVRTAPDRSVHRACCPACRSKSRPRAAGWDRWPLCLAEGDAGGWHLVAFCGCPPAAILSALVAAERAALDAELAGLAGLGSAAR